MDIYNRLKIFTMRAFIKQYWLLFVFVVAKMFLQLMLVNPVYELHRDEFLHLDQAGHLAAGYQSVPPFTSWISVIIHWLGNDIFWIRFFPALFGALTIVFAWMIVEEAGGRLYAKIVTSLALLFSVLIRMNILYQPNSFDILAWTMVFYFLIRYVNTNKVKWLFAFAIIAAIGFLNKYNILFLLSGLIPAFLITRHRVIFTRKEFYWSMALLLLLILPNIIWQVVNHFPVIHHMEALKQYQLVNINRVDFIKDQILFFMGSLPLIIASFIGFCFHKSLSRYRFVGWAFLFVILLYVLARAKSYYAMGLYPVLIALGSVYLVEVWNKGWKQCLLPVFILFNGIVLMPVLQYFIPRELPATIIAHASGYKSYGLLRWEDGRDHELPQDFADMLGWREMAQKTKDVYNSVPLPERSETLIFTDNYGQAGAINYYNQGKIPPVYSFCTDYIFWIPVTKNIRNMVLVGNLPGEDVLKCFISCQLVGRVENAYSREKGTGIFLLKGASKEFTKLFYRMRDQRIRNFAIY
jgi:hypothetical protein